MAGPRVAALEALVRELLKEQVASRIAALTEELFQAAGSLSAEDGRVAEGEPPAPGPAGETGGACSSRPTALAQVEESAVSLWNWTVTKHTGAVISDEQRAKLRFVACRLICLCEGSDPPEGTIRRQILMSMKTGKGWIDIGKADIADGFLENATSSIEKLYAKLRKGSEDEADIQVHRADVEKSLFKVLSYQAESALAQGDFQKAVMCVQRCKDMLMKLPKEVLFKCISVTKLQGSSFDLNHKSRTSYY